MSKRYSVKLKDPDGVDLGAIQATKGQIFNLFTWHDRWRIHDQRDGYKRGLLYGAGGSTAIYVAWVCFEWAVL